MLRTIIVEQVASMMVLPNKFPIKLSDVVAPEELASSDPEVTDSEYYWSLQALISRFFREFWGCTWSRPSIWWRRTSGCWASPSRTLMRSSGSGPKNSERKRSRTASIPSGTSGARYARFWDFFGIVESVFLSGFWILLLTANTRRMHKNLCFVKV